MSVLLRRSSVSSVKEEQRWRDRALNQAHFGRCVDAFTPLEAYLVNDIELINAAHTHLDVRGLRLSSSTRGGDESRRSFAAMMEEAQRMEAGGSDAVALIALNDLGTAVVKSSVSCEGLWERAFLTAYNSARDGSACGWPRD